MAQHSGYEFWSSILKGAKYVVAPMVDQSELAWRMLSRKYGAQLCYTPMLHSSVFKRDPNYRRENLVTCSEDRPLIVQFCGNDPQTLLEAARYAEPYCDAVDLNLGCPQTIAKKGRYGAFLQDRWDLLREIVSLLHRELSVPVTCKIRVFEDVEKTVRYAKMLEEAGCQLLTVHGRTREQKGVNTGVASWEHIKAVKQNVNIPVFANGNIQFQRDVERCLKETGVDGVMSAEGSLFNPAIFTAEQPPCWRMVEEYLEMVHSYPCPLSYVRGHLFKLWFHVLKQPEYQCYRTKIGTAKNIETLEQISAELKSLLLMRFTREELDCVFSLDDVPFWRCQSYVRPSPVEKVDQSCKRTRPLSENYDSTENIRKKKAVAQKEQRWITCSVCKVNPKGLRCNHNLCKICCRVKCRTELVECTGHRFYRDVRQKLAETKKSGSGEPCTVEAAGTAEQCSCSNTSQMLTGRV